MKMKSLFSPLLVRIINELAKWSLSAKEFGHFQTWHQDFVAEINRLIRYHGIKQVVKVVKTYQLHITRFLAGEPLMVNDAKIGVTKYGLPRRMRGIIPYIREGNPQIVRLILTVMACNRFVPGDGTLDTKSITEPSRAKSVTISEIEDFVPHFLGMYDFKFKTPKWITAHLTTKMGPQGHALGTCLSDLILIPEDVRASIKILGGYNLGSYMDAIVEIIEVTPKMFKHFFGGLNGLTRRISVIRDKACRNRPVAIFDYWSQTSLWPLHKMFISQLKVIPNDCTFVQHRVIDLKKGWEHYACFDLSSATDRFPLDLQVKVVSIIFGEKFGNAWKNVLVGQSFETKSQGRVSYNSGQPMGAYSSWAVFAFCHHIVMQFAARRAGYTTVFDKYAILGDDVVIGDQQVADKYLGVIQDLGVEVSIAKTHRGNTLCEFAKRTWVGDTEVSPFPIVGLMESIGRWSPFGIASILVQAIEHGWDNILRTGPDKFLRGFWSCSTQEKRSILWMAAASLEFLVLLLHNKGKDYVASMVHSIAVNAIPQYSLTWSCFTESQNNIIRETVKEEILESVKTLKRELRKNLDKCQAMADSLAKTILKEIDSGPNSHVLPDFNALYHQPWYMVIAAQLDALNELEEGLTRGMIDFDQANELLSKLRVTDVKKINSVRAAEVATRNTLNQISGVRKLLRVARG